MSSIWVLASSIEMAAAFAGHGYDRDYPWAQSLLPSGRSPSSLSEWSRCARQINMWPPNVLGHWGGGKRKGSATFLEQTIWPLPCRDLDSTGRLVGVEVIH